MIRASVFFGDSDIEKNFNCVYVESVGLQILGIKMRFRKHREIKLVLLILVLTVPFHLAFNFKNVSSISRVMQDRIMIQIDSLKGGGWSGKSFYHVTENGRKVEGVFLLKRGYLPSDNWDSRAGCLMSYKPKNRNCYWCPTLERNNDCITGTLVVGRRENNDHDLTHAGGFEGFAKFINRLRAYTKTEKKYTRVNYSFFFTCRLDREVPFGVEGHLHSDSEIKFPLTVNPRRAPIATGKSYVCVKNQVGMYYSRRLLERFVQYYVDQLKFDGVVLVEFGLAYGKSFPDTIAESSILTGYSRRSRLIVIDLREALTRMYGGFSGDIMLFSYSGAQVISDFELFFRAKSVNAEWIFFTDFDEYLVRGKNRTKFTTWPEFIDEVSSAKKNVISIEFPGRFLVNETFDQTMCDVCSHIIWNEPRSSYIHANFESEALFYLPLQTPYGKYAVKVHDNMAPPPQSIMVHWLAKECSYDGEVYIVPINDMYLRHYRDCGNEIPVCEKDEVPSWDWWLF